MTSQKLDWVLVNSDLSQELEEKGGLKWRRKGGLNKPQTIRSLLVQKEISLRDAIEEFVNWNSQIKYLLMRNRKTKRVKGYKCALRGNDVYNWRVSERLRDLSNIEDRDLFNAELKRPMANCLYVTLTTDPALCDGLEAWDTKSKKGISKRWDKFTHYLRRNFGDIDYLVSTESHLNGYPHIHALIFFNEYRFEAFFHKNKDRVGEQNLNRFYEMKENEDGNWRVQAKDRIAEGWDSFVDVKAVQNAKSGVGYITKYITKTYNQKSIAHTNTLALLWLNSKRSFSLTKDFVANCRLEVSLHNSFEKSRQIDLFGKKVSDWEVVGIYTLAEIEHLINRDVDVRHSMIDFGEGVLCI